MFHKKGKCKKHIAEFARVLLYEIRNCAVLFRSWEHLQFYSRCQKILSTAGLKECPDIQCHIVANKWARCMKVLRNCTFKRRVARVQSHFEASKWVRKVTYQMGIKRDKVVECLKVYKISEEIEYVNASLWSNCSILFF